MLILHRISTNPYFNLAAEEYLIKNLQEPCFMLWQNTASVILGKHQNPLKEVNLEFTTKNQIPIIRRISGGGTVYHDLGNLNYSFIDFGKPDSLVNFAKYSKPVLQLLQKKGVDAQLVGKSDLCINGLKFSGNASHVFRNKVLHHGTLLFNSDLDILNESIRIKNLNINDKAVNSNRSTVTNISEYLPIPMTIEEFKSELVEEIIKLFPHARIIDFSDHQKQEIENLAEEKYQTWEWNFGYSPKYETNANMVIDGKEIAIKVLVEKGFIKEIISEDDTPTKLKNALHLVIGLQHHEISITPLLQNKFDEETQIWMRKILF